MVPLNRFNRIAKFYDLLARMVFGNSVSFAQTEFLSKVIDNGNVLVLGGGSGYWLPEFLQTHPRCRIYYVEASSRMLDQAKHHAQSNPNIKFVHATEEVIGSFPIAFDSIITCFYLDMFEDEELTRVVGLIWGNLRAGGRWCISDFVSERWWHAWMLRLMYLFFKALNAVDTHTLPRWQDTIARMEMNRLQSRSYFRGFIQSIVMEKPMGRLPHKL